jgi:sn-glycerol 3-phosphate transport system substrate-binding protein
MSMIKALGGAVAVVFFLAAGSTPADAAKRHAKKPVATKANDSAAVPTEIELVQQLEADKAEQLKAMVEKFNTDSKVKIVVKDRNWASGALPDLLVLDEDDEARFLAGKPRYRPLHLVMRQAGEPLKTLKPPSMMTPAPLDSAGRIIGLPIGLSTPVMYYNRDAFRKVGLDPESPPKTWFELQQVLGKLQDAGYACPYTSSQPAWVHIENTSAWHNEPLVKTAGKREGPLVANNLLMVKHLAMMVSWYKSNYFKLFGRGDEADAKFASGECAVLTGRSSSFPTLKREANFDLGVAELPYHDDIPGAPQNTLADGPVLWVAAGQKPQQYKAIAKFVSWLLAPESQVEWQRATGFLPLNRAGLVAADSKLLKSDLISVSTAVAELTNKPTTTASRTTRYAYRPEVRRILNEELEAAWSDVKPAKEALDDAVARSRRLR